MESTSLIRLTDEQLTAARDASSARSSNTVHGGHDKALRQTVITLLQGHALGEHESPGEATLQVLRGRVRLSCGEESWEGDAGDLVVIPGARHDLLALEDCAVLLTVVKPLR